MSGIQFNKGPNDRMLEIGAGERRHPQSDCAVDVRPCQGLDFTCDLEKPWPIANDDFSIVYAGYCLEHVSWRTLKHYLKETLRVLKPGGRAVFTTANTEAQFRWIKDNPNGWDEKPIFESASCIIFGDQDYPENSHKNFLTPEIAHFLFQEASFEGVKTIAWGERQTDMLIDATKPLAPVEVTPEIVLPGPEKKEPFDLSKYKREELFDRHYFTGGGKVGGYAREGYRDFPLHEVVARNILYRKPESTLELGAARGYVTKRLQDAGVRAQAMDISRHCSMTRACEGFVLHDACEAPWPLPSQSIHTCFSQAFLEHIPDDRIDLVLQEAKRVARKQLHGIDFGGMDDGFDKTHVALHDRSYWEKKFAEHGIDVEIVDKEDLQAPPFPGEVLKGDGKVKVNVACCYSMFHHGWVNIDVLEYEVFAQQNGYIYQRKNVLEGLPFKTGDVSLLFISHFIEHLTYKEGLSFLRDCRRVIRPDGAMRIIVPDAALLLAKFAGPGLDEYDEINDGCAEAATQAGKLHALLYEGHKSTYDWPTLKQALKESGWLPRRSNFRSPQPPVREATWQILRETTDVLPCLSLYVDAFPLLDKGGSQG